MDTAESAKVSHHMMFQINKCDMFEMQKSKSKSI